MYLDMKDIKVLLGTTKQCGLVSIEFTLYSKEVEIEKWFGQKKYLYAFPIYCLVLNFRRCFIYTSKILKLFHKLFDRWLSMFKFWIHILIFGKLVLLVQSDIHMYVC